MACANANDVVNLRFERRAVKDSALWLKRERERERERERARERARERTRENEREREQSICEEHLF